MISRDDVDVEKVLDLLANNVHLIVETVLVAAIAVLILQKQYKPRRSKPLTEEVRRIRSGAAMPGMEARTSLSSPHDMAVAAETTGAILVRAETDARSMRVDSRRVLEEVVLTISPLDRDCGATCLVEGRQVRNFAQTDFLGMQRRLEVQKAAREAIEKYGCGSCGPRGFYGTIDVHLKLEEKIASFMKTEESILYSYDLATAASAIPAFCKRGDAIVCDQACNWGIKNGCVLSRSSVKFFRHNDMEDLETKLKEIVEEGKRSGKKRLNKRFIVVEGLCSQNGDLTRLDKVMELKEKYKFRILVDESLSFGILGGTGRGAVEHFGIDPGRVEIITASLGNTLGSVGGFCCGTNEIVDHQRLSGVGYCFSASLPPFLAAVGIAALEVIQEDRKDSLKKLRDNIDAMRMHFINIHPKLRLSGDPVSPLAFLYLEHEIIDQEERQLLLQQICDELLADHNVLLVVNKFSHLDKMHGVPGLKIAVTSTHTLQDISYTAECLRIVARKVLAM